MRDAAYAHPALVSALALALASSTGCAVRSSAAMPGEAPGEGAGDPAAAYADSTSVGRRSAAANEGGSAVDALGDSLGIDLPAGDGRTLVIEACTSCHDLGGVAAFKGYWNRERWASMVATMIEHGAELDEREAGLVVDYLAAHFGDGTTSSGERAGAAMERHQNGG